MYKAWHDEEYGFMLTPIELKDVGIAWVEARGWLDPERPAVVRLQPDGMSGKAYYEMPTFSLDATSPRPLCNCESLPQSTIDYFQRWIAINYITMWRHWEDLIDSVGLCEGLIYDMDGTRPRLSDDERREILQGIEAEIKAIVGDDPFRFYMDNHADETYDKIDKLLSGRTDCLNRLFRCTPDDVKRVEQVNETLYELCNSLLKRTGRLYRSTMADRDEAFDDDYEFEGELRVEIDFDKDNREKQTEVLRLPDDDFYGSDFYYMDYVVQENEKRHGHSCSYIFACHASWNRENPDPKAADEALGLTNDLDDDRSWIHPFRIPELDHICICYVIHYMLSHHNWSWPDLLRINGYWAEAKARCQRITDQKGSRYKEIIEYL